MDELTPLRNTRDVSRMPTDTALANGRAALLSRATSAVAVAAAKPAVRDWRTVTRSLEATLPPAALGRAHPRRDPRRPRRLHRGALSDLGWRRVRHASSGSTVLDNAH